MIDENAIRARYAAIKDQLDERGRRLFVAAEKAAIGYGGTAAVSRATVVARSTIIRGAQDLLAVSSAAVRIRRPGAGRPASSKADPTHSKICAHYPPGTSKWNKIEHRMFCHITRTWRGKPLVGRLAVVELIAATTTKTGLTVRCELDENSYPKATRVTDAAMAALNIDTDEWHPEWNHTIKPRPSE